MIKSLTDVYSKALDDTLDYVENRSGNYLRWIGRPKFMETAKTCSDLQQDRQEKTAIVLAGKIIYEDHFTRETIHLYRNHYPDTNIIVSVWDGEEADYLNDLKDDKVCILASHTKDYAHVDPKFVNLIPIQLGIQEAARRKASYVLRVSTAYRMTAPNLIDLFLSLLEEFPLTHDDSLTQKRRIVTSSYGSHKFIPYCINPVFTFGCIDDQLCYWSEIPLMDMSQTEAASVDADPERANINMACHLAEAFLKKQGVQVANTLADSWRVMANHFCLVDLEMLDLFWFAPATSNQKRIERRCASYATTPKQMMTFRDWLILYHRRKNITAAPEFILAMSPDEPITRNQFETWHTSIPKPTH